MRGMCAAAAMLLLGLSQPASAQSPTGVWTLLVEWPARPASVTLTLTDSAGVQRVQWQGPQGVLPATEVQWTQEQVAFVLVPEDQRGEAIRLRFRASVRGDELNGELTGRDGQVVIPVSGRR